MRSEAELAPALHCLEAWLLCRDSQRSEDSEGLAQALATRSRDALKMVTGVSALRH